MAVEPLRDDLKRAGHELVKRLDALGMKPEGAGWFFFHDLGDWRFYIASSLVELEGKKKVYSALVDAMSALGDIDGLSVFDIHLESPRDPLFQAVGSALHIKGHGNVEVHNCVFYDLLVDAVLYRMDDTPMEGRALKAAAQKFKRNAEKARERA